jgi:hypothetical protein
VKGVDTELFPEVRIRVMIRRIERNMLWEQRATAMGVGIRRIGTPYPSIKSK